MSVYRVGNKNSQLNFPTSRPSLDLDFANSKILDPRVTFTRASGGSYVGPDGLIKYAGVNEARFDHDPETGESLGLLIEESRANLLNNSNPLTGNPTTTVVVFDRSIESPDGSFTTQKVMPLFNTGNTFSASNTIFNNTGSDRTYCWSIFVKKGSYPNFQGQFGFTNTAIINYNFNTDILTISNNALGGGRILYLNGWVRIFGYTTIPNTVGFNLINVLTPIQAKQGKNTFIYQWGMQIEEGEYPTSHIPTQTSSRTRAADNASIIGKNFTDFYNPFESTIYTEARGINIFQSGFTRRYWELGASADFRTLSGYRNLTSTRLFSINNGIISADIRQTNQVIDGKFIKSISAFRDNYFSLYSTGKRDNEQITSSGKLPVVNIIRFGSDAGSLLGTVLNGTIKRFTYWPKILPNEQLQTLTK